MNVAPSPEYHGGGIEWADVAEITGGRIGEFDAPCPACSLDRRPRNQKKRVLRVWRHEEDFAGYHCIHCGAKGWVRADPGHRGPLQPRGRLLRAFDPLPIDKVALERERLEKRSDAEFTFFSASEIGGTIAQAYLASRGLMPGADLRFHRFAPETLKGTPTSPAMIAGYRSPNGELVGIQATFLSPHGSKLKRLSFGWISGGGAVRLAPICDGMLAVAEGVETALAFTSLYETPCWATLGTSGLRAFEPPEGVRQLIIAADNDPRGDGLAAAMALAKQAQRKCEVTISAPQRVKDWNDALQRGAA